MAFTIRRHHVAIMAVLGIVALAVVGRHFEGGPPSARMNLGPPEVSVREPLKPTDVHPLLGYPLDRVAESKLVPHVFIDQLKVDLSRIPDIDDKKQTFFRILLPYVAQENDRILADREKLLANPDSVPASLYVNYETEPGDVQTLLRRVDIVPASLVLAQAALESGWGSSRFALEGNNFFGMRTYNDDTPGIKPNEADGFKVIRFDDIGHSVRAYMRNINTHDAYKALRAERANQRHAGLLPTGNPLTKFLTAYSEIPEKYGALLRDVIKAAGLERFDGVRLATN